MSRQLLLEFVETPEGGDVFRPSGEPDAKDVLRHKSRARKTKDIAAAAEGGSPLLEEVASEANLAKALLHVVRNKGAAGVDGESVEEVLAKADWLLPRLSRELLEGRYRPEEIRRVWIPKPGGGERGLGIPTVVDRWIQQAIYQVLAPIYESTFHQSSHGFRPCRGVQTALPEVRTLVEAGKDWVVSVDLSKFFDRVNHQRLMSRLAKRITDGRLLRLIHQMLKAKVVLPDGVIVTVEEGTPQGGPLSPLLSNIVLDELDWELERRGLSFVRYADDLNVFVSCKRAGARVMAGLTRFVEQRLRLKVNEDKTVVDRPENVHILGFSVSSTGTTTEVFLSKRSSVRLRQKIRELTPRNWGQSMKSLLEKANEYLEGWSGYFRLVTKDGAQILRKMDAHIRRRIRCYIICRFPKQRYLLRHLLEQGAPKTAAAKLAYSRINKWFKGRLTSLWDEWLKRNLPPTAAASSQILFDFGDTGLKSRM
jgi:RNA-directed DNA polymerase